MFGQQMQNPIASAAKWIFFGFFSIIGMAILLGFNVKDAKWLSPSIAEAEARRIEIETDHQQATYETQERLNAAQAEADIQQIQREQKLLDAQYQHDIQVLEQDLAHSEIAFKTWMTVLTIFASACALVLFVGTLIWISVRAWVYIQTNSRKEHDMAKIIPQMEKSIPNLPERKIYNPWSDPAYRREQRVAAQNKEREETATIIARIRGISSSEQVNASKYNDLPLAGD